MIGAQKSGTTFLASLLDQSVDVCVSDPKEPHYLTHQYDQGAAYYSGCFADPTARIRIDASTTYSMLRPRRAFDVADAPGVLDPVPQRIKDAVQDPKFIYIMRDPVKRAISAYRHLARHDKVRAKSLSLIACFEADPMLELTGRYADQIERYLEVFDRDQFLFLDFQDLLRDLISVIATTCDFLGISAAGIALEPEKAERNSAYQTSAAGHALKKVARFVPGIRKAARQVLPDSVQKVLINQVFRESSQIRFSDEAKAAERFSEDRARVKALTGLMI